LNKVEIQRRESTDSSANIFNQVPTALAKIYAARGLKDQQQLGRSLADLLPDSGLADIEKATKRVAQAINQKQHIIVVGDFDCDGATSTAVLILGLRMMGVASVDYLVPNRFSFGYGLSPEIVEVAAQDNPQLIITVDNGVSSIEGVEKANSLGIDVVVTDHHLAGDELPNAVAIVNPNRKDCSFEAKSTCGVGVVFYLLIALRRELAATGWFDQNKLSQPNLASLLDLVALGTVADVVPLERNNRTLVYQGLQRIRAGRTRPGLKALIEVANKRIDKLVASDLGFVVAPRLNAAGRLDDMSVGIECLLCEDYDTAREYALTLDRLNLERREIEQGMQIQALSFLEKIEFELINQDKQLPMGLCLFDVSWHQGVVGILASRIKDKLHRPIIAFAPGDNGEIKGSARSISCYHLRDGLALIDTLYPGLIKKFGGHAMAAGLTIDETSLPKFEKAFAQVVKQSLAEDDLKATLLTDGSLHSQDLTIQTASMFKEAGPWGHSFSEPLFDNEFKIIQQRIVGKKHLKLVLMDPETGTAVDAIYFNIDEKVWPDESIEQVRVVYKLDVNEFRGKQSVQLLVEYIDILNG
jgi:single-stranded-DNA-specific exonuclease